MSRTKMKVFQLHPTMACNLRCTWCPYKEKNGNEIPFPEIQHQLSKQRKTGCRILKISGGGEPTLYRDFHELLRYANDLGYIVYLQTNGTLLDSFIRKYVHDIRLSFGDGIPFTPPNIRSDGFSYVVSSNPEYDNLTELIKYALGHGIYVRVTQDDTNLDNIPSIEEIKVSIHSCRKPYTSYTKGKVYHQMTQASVGDGGKTARRQDGKMANKEKSISNDGGKTARRQEGKTANEEDGISNPTILPSDRLASSCRKPKASVGVCRALNLKENLPNSRDLTFQIKSGISEAERLNSDGPNGSEHASISLLRFWDAHNFHKGKNPCPCHASPLLTPFRPY